MKSLYSMTGYAEAAAQMQGAHPALAVRVELRSVNGRFLDLNWKLPDEARASEPQLRALLAGALRRGKVECRVTVEQPQGAGAQPDSQVVEQLLQAEAALRARAPHLRPLSVGDLWRLAATQAGTRVDAQQLGAALLHATETALAALQSARAAEGQRLGAFMLARCAQLHDWARKAEQLAPQAVLRQQERFVARFNEALQAVGAAGDAEAMRERTLQETAAYAMRIDVAEEISRLLGHIEAVRSVIAGGGEVGKRLDFLIQELHREANTLGSKSALAELSELAVDMKVCIEQMREQVQNLE